MKNVVQGHEIKIRKRRKNAVRPTPNARGFNENRKKVKDA